MSRPRERLPRPAQLALAALVGAAATFALMRSRPSSKEVKVPWWHRMGYAERDMHAPGISLPHHSEAAVELDEFPFSAVEGSSNLDGGQVERVGRER